MEAEPCTPVPAEQQPDAAPAVSSASVVTLDEARDFFYTSMRALERFCVELKATVTELEARKPSDEWLEASETQLRKGALFLDQQLELWGAQSHAMDAYIASVRALADEEAIRGPSPAPWQRVSVKRIVICLWLAGKGVEPH
jgi:hypothetical protein